VTAKRPGAMQVNASVSGTTALPAPFTTCPPASIVIGQQGNSALTDFSVASPQTTILAATVTDTKGNPITDLNLIFLSSTPGVASVATSSLTATVTANSAGRAGVVASCTPIACNPGVNRPIYSNVATFTVTGTTSPKVVAASANSNTVAIIDSTNAVVASPAIPSITINGTATTPQLNSVVMSGDGNKAFFGSNVGVLQLDLGTNSFLSTAFLFAGKVLAASADGSKVLVTDGGSFSVIDASATQSNTYPILNATAADLSLDTLKLFAVSGSTLNGVNRAGTAVTPITLAASGSDVKFLKQGSVAFVAEPGANAQMFATCDNSPLGSVAAQPQLLASSSDSARMFGANTTTVFSITPTVAPPTTPTTNSTDCAPQTASGTLPTSVDSAALGTTVSPRQIIAAPNASRAVVLGDATSVFVYNNTANTVTAIALSNGGTSTTGGITPDGATLYVGTTAGDVQKIDLAGGVVLQSIATGLKNGAGAVVAPDFVAVRPK
jgi:trimeric autotransporter adhesin